MGENIAQHPPAYGMVADQVPTLEVTEGNRIPRQFENAVLAPRDREKGRHEAVTNIRRLVDEQEVEGFDIDAVSEADLERPDFPVPAFFPERMDENLKQEELLPPGFDCRELEPKTYALSIPMEKYRTGPGLHRECIPEIWC